MSRLSPAPSVPLGHQPSKASIAASDITFQTFYTAAPTPTPRPPLSTPVHAFSPPPATKAILEQAEPTPAPPSQPSRQDSGYESIARKSFSSRRRTSGGSPPRDFYVPDAISASVTSLQAKRSLRRAGKAVVTQHTARASGSSLHLERAHTLSQARFIPAQASQSTTFFHFPSTGHGLVRPHTSSGPVAPLAPFAEPQSQLEHKAEEAATPPSPPPQTQHYWTSDYTRRMEYAAIDAASRGFRGWCLRHIVPDCIIPHEQRRLGFGDDGGSVRRYRLELEGDEKDGGRAGESHTQRVRPWLRKYFCV